MIEEMFIKDFAEKYEIPHPTLRDNRKNMDWCFGVRKGRKVTLIKITKRTLDYVDKYHNAKKKEKIICCGMEYRNEAMGLYCQHSLNTEMNRK